MCEYIVYYCFILESYLHSRIRYTLYIMHICTPHILYFLISLYSLQSKHPLRLTPGVKEFIAVLHSKQVPVYLVSGGFRQVCMHIILSIYDLWYMI